MSKLGVKGFKRFCFVVALVLLLYLFIFYTHFPASQEVKELMASQVYNTQIPPDDHLYTYTFSSVFDDNSQNKNESNSTSVEDILKVFSILPKQQKKKMLRLCPDLRENRNLIGHISQATLLIEELEESEIEQYHRDVSPGGNWRPNNCRPRSKIAIIIPYRDRRSHLIRLLDFLIPILQRQMVDFRIIVTEQYGENLFNKGRIMNAAFRLSQQLGVDCVIFHDVDMFPQDDRIPYNCPTNGPRHLGAFLPELGYQLLYKEIVGGVLAINMNDYLRINGFSNSYWAWGGEDDDMGKRILSNNFTIERPSDAKHMRFSMIKHVKRKRLAPKLVYKLLANANIRWVRDGVNETNVWKILKIEKKPLYYHLLVDVGKPPADWKGER